MKLHVRHTFACTPEQYWISFWEDEIEQRKSGATKMRIETIEERKEGDVTVLTQRYYSNISLPKMVAKIVGSDTLHYDQTSRIDETANQIRWEVVPPAVPDKVTAKGTVTIREIPGGIERVLDGVVEVRVPMVGGQIEKGIVEGITKGHEEDRDVRSAWLAERFGG